MGVLSLSAHELVAAQRGARKRQRAGTAARSLGRIAALARLEAGENALGWADISGCDSHVSGCDSDRVGLARPRQRAVAGRACRADSEALNEELPSPPANNSESPDSDPKTCNSSPGCNGQGQSPSQSLPIIVTPFNCW